MMKIEYLTPDEIRYFDPSGNNLNLLKMLPKTDDKSYFSELSPFYGTSFDIYRDLVNKYLSDLSDEHRPYVQYNREMFSKCGRQGGKFSLELLRSKIQQYYKPDFCGSIPEVLIAGRDFLIKLIKEKISQEGYPQITKIDHPKTYGALPSGQPKGSFAAETLGVNKISLQRFYPTVPGERRMRNKDRAIFMDATPNVRAQETYLTAARNWLKKHFPQFFGSWVNPNLVVNPAITHQIDRKSWFVSWDYSSMDVNFTKRIAMELILPVYETMFPDRKLSIGAHFEQNFEQPIFMGEYLLTGTHSLLSGANITNDFETLYTVMLAIGAFLKTYGYAALRMLLALGDDLTLCVKTREQASKILDLATEVSNAIGMTIHPEKSSITQSEVTYCRKVYYPKAKRDANGVIIGAYPSILVLNNIIQPENPNFTAGVSLCADLQRMDNLYGSPDYQYVLSLLARDHKYDSFRTSGKDPEFLKALKEFSSNLSDWWQRLYGEAWQPDASLSFRRLVNLMPKKRQDLSL